MVEYVRVRELASVGGDVDFVSRFVIGNGGVSVSTNSAAVPSVSSINPVTAFMDANKLDRYNHYQNTVKDTLCAVELNALHRDITTTKEFTTTGW